jgi:predicted transcriptional regulator of viral defense system
MQSFRHFEQKARKTYMSSSQFEQVIGSIAARQHGVVTRSQLLCAGVPADTVDRRIKAGRLRRVRQGVYQIGPIISPRAAEKAAVLSCGTGSVLSHWSAASCWRALPAREQADVHVLVAGRRPAARPGVCIHLVAALRADEITTHDNIPITTPERTLYDLAGRAERRELERALAEALALRLTTSVDLSRVLDRYRQRPGARRLQTLLERGSRPALTRSQAEERFLALIDKGQLREPECNVVLEGYEVDCFWPAERLVVEIDGRAYHSSDRAFEVIAAAMLCSWRRDCASCA